MILITVITAKEIRQLKVVLIQVLNGIPKTEAILNPEKTHETNHARFSSGAIRLAKVRASEIIIPETVPVIIREASNQS